MALISREIADGHVIADGVAVFEGHRKAGGEIAQDVLENKVEGTDQGSAGQQGVTGEIAHPGDLEQHPEPHQHDSEKLREQPTHQQCGEDPERSDQPITRCRPAGCTLASRGAGPTRSTYGATAIRSRECSRLWASATAFGQWTAAKRRNMPRCTLLPQQCNKWTGWPRASRGDVL